MTETGLIRHVGSYRAELGECPTWDAASSTLVWLDMERHRILRTVPESGDTTITQLSFRPGAVVLHGEGGMLVASGHDIYHLDETNRLTAMASLPPDAAGGFNDGVCDPSGRFWSGTATGDGSTNCALYRYDGTIITAMADGMSMSNGVGFSPDGMTMYFVDSAKRTLDSFAFDVRSGTLDDRRTLLTLPPGKLPDGLAVDRTGAIWVAVWGGACVLKVTPDGAIERTLNLPTPNVTACTFGGPDMRTLFITTAQQDLDAAPDPLAGALFACEVDVPGMSPECFRPN